MGDRILRALRGRDQCRFCSVKPGTLHQPKCFLLFCFTALDFWDVRRDWAGHMMYRKPENPPSFNDTVIHAPH